MVRGLPKLPRTVAVILRILWRLNGYSVIIARCVQEAIACNRDNRAAKVRVVDAGDAPVRQNLTAVCR